MDDDDNDESNKENDEDNDDGVDDVLPSVTKRNKTLDSALEASQKLWKTIVDLVKCDDMRDVFELTLSASASIQLIERSSPIMGESTILSWVDGLEQILRRVQKMTFLMPPIQK
jgi:hypothetical protein